MKNLLKYCLDKIANGFFEHIGIIIAISIGSYLGTYFGGQKVSDTMVKEIIKRDTIFITKNDSTFIENKVSKFITARDFELAGFQALLDKDIDKAIKSFEESEKSANKYHASYEIAKYLNKNKEHVSEPEFWEHTYQFVIAKNRSYIPLEYLSIMEESLHSN